MNLSLEMCGIPVNKTGSEEGEKSAGNKGNIRQEAFIVSVKETGTFWKPVRESRRSERVEKRADVSF